MKIDFEGQRTSRPRLRKLARLDGWRASSLETSHARALFHMSARFVSWPRAVALVDRVRDVSPVDGVHQ